MIERDMPNQKPGQTPRPCRVLLVDDEEAVRRVVIRLLASLGCPPESVVSSRQEALSLFQPGRFDLLLSDVGLAGEDGIALALELKDRDPALKIVIMSGNPQHLNRARDAGFHQLLQKPFASEELQALIESLG